MDSETLTQRFDHHNGATPANELRALYTQMREECPVAQIEKYGGFTVLSRYDDVMRVLRDSASFTSGDGVFIPPTGAPLVAALEFDEPEHSLHRSLMNPPLLLPAIRRLQPAIQDVADVLIDNFAERGSAELVSEFAEPMPAIVIGRMIGLNQAEAITMRQLAIALFNSIGSPDMNARAGEFLVFAHEQLEERRREPRDDYLSALASGRIDGVDVDPAAVPGFLIAFLLGGHHSTAAGIAGLLHDVFTVPRAREIAEGADPTQIDRLVEESLRFHTPLQFFARTVQQDAQLHGICVERQTRIMMNLAAANRDDAAFENPESFDPDRDANRHLAFGGGRHICQGQHLARAEMRTAVTALLRRLPDVRLAKPAKESGLTSGMLLGYDELTVTFTGIKSSVSTV